MKNKYRNILTEVDGIKFHSRREAKRYQELKLLQRAGEIKGLVLQDKFEITVNDSKICTYVADFTYWKKDGETRVIEDVKGYRTKEYILKRKLMKAVYGIEILET